MLVSRIECRTDIVIFSLKFNEYITFIFIKNKKSNPISFGNLFLLIINKKVIKRIIKLDICGSL